jgi:hypothetical protein
MSNYVRYRGETGRSPSPKIFGDMAKLQHDSYLGKCIFLWDDFGFNAVHATAQASGGWYTVQDTGVTVEGQSAVSDLALELGVLEVIHDGTDNDEAYIQFGSGNMFRMANSAGNTGRCGFEMRLKTNTIADDGMAFFAGFGSTIVAANYLVDNDGTLVTTESFVGFRRLQDDGDKVDTIYQEASQTLATVLANAATLVANTYINLGFVYNPNFPDATQVRFYVDNVESNTYITRTNMDAATFPEDIGLQPMFLCKIGTATAFTAQLDWVAAYQYLSDE